MVDERDRQRPTDRADREAAEAAAVEGWTEAEPLRLGRLEAPLRDADGDVLAYRPADDPAPVAWADRLFRIWLGWLVTMHADGPADVAELVAEAGDVARVTADGALAFERVPGSVADWWAERFDDWIEARPWVEVDDALTGRWALPTPGPTGRRGTDAG